MGKPDGGIDISYPLSEGTLLNYDEFPTIGLYYIYVNNVRGEYTLDGKKVSEVYKIRTSPFTGRITEGKYEVKPKVESAKTVKGFEGRSVFDNGDGRGLKQPALAQNKWSRAVEYKIDKKKMTVEQTWQFGKEGRWNWYSPVTFNVKWDSERQTYWMLSGNALLLTKERTKAYIMEVDPKTNEAKVEIVLSTDKKPGVFYRNHLVNPQKPFAY